MQQHLLSTAYHYPILPVATTIVLPNVTLPTTHRKISPSLDKVGATGSEPSAWRELGNREVCGGSILGGVQPADVGLLCFVTIASSDSKSYSDCH